ncbi:MAG: hypothetical protein CMF96_11465 [Candidatus Marinimicrobia bacterium]|nr:hypothetical protein [Candidatus Neomarinimicrobiota bacterium]|tara:strand:+ start:336 stop:716 length:381 start_codon:yes stop_codon:yes gene_type:complete
MNNLITILILALTISFYIFKRERMNENSISVDLLRDKLKTEDNIGIIDVRTINEYNGPKGYIQGSINIPLSNISNHLKDIKLRKFKEIYVICLSGARSASAISILSDSKINAQNVKGGIIAWNKMK